MPSDIRNQGIPPGTDEDAAKMQDTLKKYITDIPDCPQKGVIFRDITPLLQSAPMFRYAIDLMTVPHRNQDIELVVAMESRGFIFSPIAFQLGAGFVPIRKVGKLPRETLQCEYELEYGAAGVEIHKDAIHEGQKVLLVDDVLATGGTAEAAVKLIEQLGGEIVAAQFLIELTALRGRDKLTVPVNSLILY